MLHCYWKQRRDRITQHSDQSFFFFCYALVLKVNQIMGIVKLQKKRFSYDQYVQMRDEWHFQAAIRSHFSVIQILSADWSAVHILFLLIF